MYSFLYKGLLRLLATLASTSSRRGGSLLPIVRKTSRQTPIYLYFHYTLSYPWLCEFPAKNFTFLLDVR